MEFPERLSRQIRGFHRRRSLKKKSVLDFDFRSAVTVRKVLARLHPATNVPALVHQACSPRAPNSNEGIARQADPSGRSPVGSIGFRAPYSSVVQPQTNVDTYSLRHIILPEQAPTSTRTLLENRREEQTELRFQTL